MIYTKPFVDIKKWLNIDFSWTPPGGLVNILCFYSELSNRELNTKCIQKLILYDIVLASTQARANRQAGTMANDYVNMRWSNIFQCPLLRGNSCFNAATIM